MDDLVKLSVNGIEFSGWESLSITRTLDSCADSFSLSGPFDPDNQVVVNSFRPFGYQRAVVKIDSELVLTGRIETVEPSTNETDRAINVQGRSLTGPLIDCSVDMGRFQFDGLTLAAIASQVCKPHGVTVIPLNDTAILKEARIEPGQTCFDFLNTLARDGGLLLTCDSAGSLIIKKSTPGGVPVASLVEGVGNVKQVTGSYNGSARFSSYKVLQQQDGTPAITGTATDAGVASYRPRIETGAEGDAKDINKAAAWRRALALSASVGVSVDLSGWRNPTGALWSPGDFIVLKAPGAYILRETTFIIAEASLKLDTSSGRTSALRLVLPSTYSGEMPGVYPWV